MKDTEKYDALSLIARLLSLGPPPTLRDTGLPEATIEELRVERFLKLGDRGTERYPDERDRFVILELTTAANAWYVRYESDKEAREATLPGQFRSTWRSKAVEAVWEVVKLAVAAAVGWHLHRYFGTD